MLCVRKNLAPNILYYLMHGSGVVVGAVTAGVKYEVLQAITPVDEICWNLFWWVVG